MQGVEKWAARGKVLESSPSLFPTFLKNKSVFNVLTAGGGGGFFLRVKKVERVAQTIFFCFQKGKSHSAVQQNSEIVKLMIMSHKITGIL